MQLTNTALCFLFVLTLLTSFGVVRGQSLDISAPSPISTKEVAGRIEARDLGDSRLTDHYYAFAATPGDLLVTIESKNLNGDIDVFTTAGLRPLMKFTVYADSSAPVTKGIFLRKREDLVLRVQARTPNDDEGIYQIRFGGSFEPLEVNPLLAQTDTQNDAALTSGSASKKGRRVSSVGARIEEPQPPPAEVATAPTPEPTPVEQPAPVESPAVESNERNARNETATTTPSTSRSRRPSGRRTPARRRPATETDRESETVKTPNEQPAEKPAESGETAEARPTRRTGSRRSAPKEPPKETAQDLPDTGPRLVIETADGTLIDRSMSTVRRVMVENGQVVVVGKDGRVLRVALAQVVKMSISPQ